MWCVSTRRDSCPRTADAPARLPENFVPNSPSSRVDRLDCKVTVRQAIARAHLNLGHGLPLQLTVAPQAERWLQDRHPPGSADSLPAYVNLADLYRQQRDEGGEQLRAYAAVAGSSRGAESRPATCAGPVTGGEKTPRRCPALLAVRILNQPATRYVCLCVGTAGCGARGGRRWCWNDAGGCPADREGTVRAGDDQP